MKTKMSIVSLCLMTALGIGCGGENEPGPEPHLFPTEIPVAEDQQAVEDQPVVVEEEEATAVSDDATEASEESETLAIPANCTLDEVATGGEIRRSIIAGNILLAMVTYEIDAESGGFVSINGGNCSYDYAYFTETNSTLCHTNIPCDDGQFEYYVDYSNRAYPIWVLLAGDTRWVLGRFTGTLPPVSTASAPSWPSSPSVPTPAPSAPAPAPSAPAPTPSVPTFTDDGGDWEDAVRGAYRGQGEAMPYNPIPSW